MKDPFQAELRRTLAPLLEPLGFRQHGRVWNRRRDGAIDIIEIQKSQYNVTEASSFTINIGFVPASAVPPQRFALPSHSWPQIRIGGTGPAQQDVWYDYRTDDTTMLHEAINRAGQDIVEHGLPWLVAQSRPYRAQFKIKGMVVAFFAKFGIKLREPDIETLGSGRD